MSCCTLGLLSFLLRLYHSFPTFNSHDFFPVVFLNIAGLLSLCAAEQSQLEYRGLAAWLKLWSTKLFYYESIMGFAVWWVTEVFRELIQAKCFIAYSSVSGQGQAWSMPVSHIPASMVELPVDPTSLKPGSAFSYLRWEALQPKSLWNLSWWMWHCVEQASYFQWGSFSRRLCSLQGGFFFCCGS